jgi:cytochrome d ubiquinol oxidase subunit II
MAPVDLLLIVMLIGLTLYAVLGGADFGVGVWECITALQSSEMERRHMYKAIGPVWEANHVWLIFVLLILLNGFPIAFAALSRALWLPLLLALCGIVFRGAGYVFWTYGRDSGAAHTAWEGIFAVASTTTPLFLGASAGSIASGKLAITESGQYLGDYMMGWISPLAVFSSFYLVAMCAYLSAVYLAREARQIGDDDLLEIWRQRSLSTGLLLGLLSFAGLFIVWLDAPPLAAGFVRRGWPFVIASVACGIGSLIEVWRSNNTRAAIASAGAVTTVIWGWGVSQYPLIIPPSISSADTKAPDNVLWMMLVVIALGVMLLLPALGYLLVLFKSSRT